MELNYRRFVKNEEHTDQVLLVDMAKNDAKAIETIYKHNFNMVQSFVLNNNGNYDDARDVFQEAMIVLYQKVTNENFVLTCKLNTFIYSLSRRIWLKKLTQIGRHSSDVFETISETVAVENDIELHEKRSMDLQIMQKALDNLGEPCKSLLEGFYFKQMDMQSLAKEFGYTNADNTKTQKYKCLMRLKKLFFAHYNIGD